MITCLILAFLACSLLNVYVFVFVSFDEPRFMFACFLNSTTLNNKSVTSKYFLKFNNNNNSNNNNNNNLKKKKPKKKQKLKDDLKKMAHQ